MKQRIDGVKNLAQQKKTTTSGTKGKAKSTVKSPVVKKNTTEKASIKQQSPKETTRMTTQKSRFGDSILDEVILIIIMLISLVAEISLVTEKMGIVGQMLNSLFKGLFGASGVLLPIFIIIFCGWLFISEERKMPVVRAIGGLIFLLCISAGMQIINPIDVTEGLSFFKKIGFYYGEGTLTNGGYFGAVFGGLLYRALDTMGSTLVLIALLIISVIMATGKSFFLAIGDFSANQKTKQVLRNERIKSRAEQIRQMELAEAQKLERRRKKVEKQANYNIELNRDGFSGVEPMVEATVFRKKEPTTFKKAEPIYNFTLEEYQATDETSAMNAETDFEIEDFANNTEELTQEPPQIMIRAQEPLTAEEQPQEQLIDEIFKETVAEAPIQEDVESIENEVEVDEDSLFASLEEEYLEKYGNEAEEADETPKKETIGNSSQKQEEVVPQKPIEEEIPYQFPSIEFLGNDPKTGEGDTKEEMLANAKKLELTLKSFGVEAKVIQINKGPTVTRYELSPNQGVKVSKIVNLSDDIALNLAASGIRIEAPIPGKAAVGIEVPNRETQSVYLRTVIDSDTFKNHPSKVAFALGEDIAGNPVVTDIAKMPHLLIAGATGSGKSVCINTLITSILYKADPKEVKLLLVDPKVVELSVYNGIPHLLIPVVTDPKKASAALNWAVREMLQRYNDFAACGVRDIKGFNAMKDEERDEKGKMPQIVIVIDELADLMMAAPGEVEDAICRLAQMARAAGMHLIIATQRPSVDVITGVIKANIPSRLAFAVSSGIDSRTILDMVGAEKLLGKGDMLFYPSGQSKPARMQGAFVTDKEVEDIVSFLKKSGRPDYTQETIDQITQVAKGAIDAGEDSDEFFEQAVELIIEKEKASVSMLQRQFRIGYNRAARLMDELESNNFVGPEDGSKPRKTLITRAQWETIKNPVDEEI